MPYVVVGGFSFAAAAEPLLPIPIPRSLAAEEANETTGGDTEEEERLEAAEEEGEAEGTDGEEDDIPRRRFLVFVADPRGNIVSNLCFQAATVISCVAWALARAAASAAACVAWVYAEGAPNNEDDDDDDDDDDD